MKIRLCKPYFGNMQEAMIGLKSILESGFLTQGKYTKQFEEDVSKFLEVKHAIAVNSGTSALHLSLLALDIKPGDEILVPAYTFHATANVVETVKAKPVFIDVNLETYNINPEAIKEKITSKTKAIMPVHLFGNPAAMDKIKEIAEEHNLAIIEDAAAAFGAEYKGKKCGTLGDIGCFSFHPRKIITTGEGGMIVTNNDEFAEKIRSMRNHGIQAKTKDVVEPGFNFRMSEVEAFLGTMQMKEITQIIEKRETLTKKYCQILEKSEDIEYQKCEEESKQALQAFVIRLKNQESAPIIKFLRDKGIESTIGTYAVNLLTFYKEKYHETYPYAEELFTHTIALPFFHELSEEEINLVCEELMEALQK